MRAGKLDRLVTLQTFTSGRDADYGSETKTWTTLAQVWARVEGVSGREFFSARQTGAERTLRLTIRYRSDVTEKLRVLLDGGRTLEVHTLREIGRRRGLELICGEINAGGS